MSETRRVRMLAAFAGPHGTGQEGDVRDLPADVAAAFVDGGYAEYVEAEAPEEAGEEASAAEALAVEEAPAPVAEEAVPAVTPAPEEAEPITSESEVTEPEAPGEAPNPVELPAEAQGI